MVGVRGSGLGVAMSATVAPAGPVAQCNLWNQYVQPMKSYDLNLLRVLDAVLAAGSVTAAAPRLHLSVPATSHALARLRERARAVVHVGQLEPLGPGREFARLVVGGGLGHRGRA